MPALSTFRFCFLITLAMRIITAHDALLVRRRQSSLARHSEINPSSLFPQIICQPLTIQHATRTLEGQFYSPLSIPQAAVLLLHGIGDKLAYWQDAQSLLAEHNVASLIIHYSGYGHSSGAITPNNLAADTHAGYAHLQTLVPGSTPLFVLGFSMGTGVLAGVVHELDPRPVGIILCQAFPSLRAAAATAASSKWLAPLMPDLWRTAETLRSLPAPLLVVHTPQDPLFPVTMAEEIASGAATQTLHPVTLATPAGLGHDDVFLRPRQGYWSPILNFIRLHASPTYGPPV